MLKRSFDFLAALVGAILCAPLMLAVAVWVKFDSAGPVLFRQRRVGLNGRVFSILKFRSMAVDAAARGPQITSNADRRITRSGAWLRKLKIDELPQLFNVLRGEMSLVGPRPEVERYVAMYSPADREIVLSVRPGITDLASIEFRDEGELLAAASDPERAYVEEIMPRKLSLYRQYVRERSFFGDLNIIFRTLLAVVKPAKTACGADQSAKKAA